MSDWREWIDPGPWIERSNELGHALARPRSESRVPPDKYAGKTLGAYRRGKNMPWVPGALIDAWVACASMESRTGVPWPHCYFIQTIGEADGGFHCPGCVAERAKGVPRPVWKEPDKPGFKSGSVQGSLF